MSSNEKASYFDNIADKWDGFIEDKDALNSELKRYVKSFGIRSDSVIADIGCGTGNLTLILLENISENGCIHAVDISEKMIDIAKKKIQDKRVSWYVRSAESLPIRSGSCDFILFYSVWPHIDDKKKAIAEAWRTLKTGGRFIIWHTQSRDRINEIHKNINDIIKNDILLPAETEKNNILKKGFKIICCEESDKHYLIISEKK